MAPIWSYQPLKALYLLAALAGTPPLLILYAIRFLAPPLRPVRRWSVISSVMSRFSRILLRTVGSTRLKTPVFRQAPRGTQDRFVLIEPSTPDVYSSLPQNPSIVPGPVGSLWYPSPPASNLDPNDKVVLHLPGGAFIMAFPPQQIGPSIYKTWSDGLSGSTKVLFAQYRIAHDPLTRFPASIQDAITAYTYLLKQGIPPKNIILSGDSAGGNLLIALVRHLSSGVAGLPLPRGAVAWSPWVDVTEPGVRAIERHPNYMTDVLPNSLMWWGLEAYGSSEEHMAPWVCPASHPFKTSIPLVLHAGEVEVLRDEIQAFAKEMQEVNGEMVRYRETEDLPHDLILCHEAYAMTDKAAAFVKESASFFEDVKRED